MPIFYCLPKWNARPGDGLMLLVMLAIAPAAGCLRATPDAAPGPPSAASAARTLDDVWDAAYLQGKKIGWTHTVRREEGEGQGQRITIRSVTHLKMMRGGAPTEMEMVLSSVRSPDGRVMWVASESSLGAGLRRLEGVVQPDKLIVTVRENGAVQTQAFPWTPEVGDYFAVEQSLRDAPLQPGEQRQMKMWLPLLDTVGTVTLNAGPIETTQLLSGRFQLQHIDQTIDLADGSRLTFTLWTDEAGTILKTLEPASGQETYRVPREVAERDEDAPDLDILLDLVVKLDRPRKNPLATRRAVYRVSMRDGDPAQLLATGASQQVETLDSQTALVTVTALRPPEPGTRQHSRGEVDPEALASSSLIESDDPEVQRLAASAAGEGRSTWEIAVELESLVAGYIEEKDYSQAFASAAQVLRTRKGDCTEHAVLLAALCRARGIPARVAVGLVYVESLGGMAFHMWTEVAIDGRWFALDATRPQGGIGAGYLKLSDSTLHGPAAYTSFLPVMGAIGRLHVELVEAQ